jgi:hypothetical protein
MTNGILIPNPGRVTARRLNRPEYNNTVRDLLKAHIRPADEFPVDNSGYGFDNIGDVLSLSPMLMEKYLAAARELSRLAVFGHPVPPKPITIGHYVTKRSPDTTRGPAARLRSRLRRQRSCSRRSTPS